MNETEVCYKKIFKKRRKELDKVQNEQCRVQLKDMGRHQYTKPDALIPG